MTSRMGFSSASWNGHTRMGGALSRDSVQLTDNEVTWCQQKGHAPGCLVDRPRVRAGALSGGSWNSRVLYT